MVGADTRLLGAARGGSGRTPPCRFSVLVVVLVGGCRSFSPCREVDKVEALGLVGVVKVMVVTVVEGGSGLLHSQSLVGRPTRHIVDALVALEGGAINSNGPPEFSESWWSPLASCNVRLRDAGALEESGGRLRVMKLVRVLCTVVRACKWDVVAVVVVV